MIENTLHEIWKELSYKYMDEKYSYRLWRDIVKNYNNKKRHYHNLTHIYDMVHKYYLLHIAKLDRPDEVLFAIFYHDIVYSTLRPLNNELLSAIHMDNSLERTKLNEEQLEFIYNCIYATKTHSKSFKSDINYMIDFDMSILGQSWEDYSEYTKNTRSEYKMYPNCIYKRGRKTVLKSFLMSEQIFKTEEFYKVYEKQARVNIQRELDSL